MGFITPADGFLTTDGTFYPTREEALAHQHGLDLKEEIRKFVLGEDGGVHSIDAYTEINAITRWEEHRKLKELKQ
jgi:hypothetical protein